MLVRLAVLLLVAAGVAACEDPTFEIRFTPEQGETFSYRSAVHTDVTRSLEGDDPERAETDTVLDATQEVVGVGAAVDVVVRVTRDGEAPREFTVQLDRGARLSAFDLVEGIPLDALGFTLDAGVGGVDTSPPPGPLEVGDTWTVDAGSVTGLGRVASLARLGGADTASTAMTLFVPLTGSVPSDSGDITFEGRQRVDVVTVYDLADGSIVRSSTTTRGALAVTVAPPAGVEALPVDGHIRYRLDTETTRLPREDAS